MIFHAGHRTLLYQLHVESFLFACGNSGQARFDSIACLTGYDSILGGDGSIEN